MDESQAESPGVFALSIHAHYACRDAGACCSAGWTIPVEQPLRVVLGTDLLTPEADGRCRFHAPESHRCSIHHRHGHGALPLACRMFPRRALVDRDGIHVTLSHFCPTAAGLLFDPPAPLAIVERPPAFPAAAIEDALDARDAWPPLVAPRLLFDLDAYRRWERFVVTTLAEPGPADAALARIAGVAEAARAWTPAAGPMDAYLRGRIDAAATAPSHALQRYSACAGRAARRLALDATPADLKPAGGGRDDDQCIDQAWDDWSQPVRYYLAAKAFASWSAYQASGVRTLVAELVLAVGLVRAEAARLCAAAARPLDRGALLEAIRAADWLLMHAADRHVLLKALGRIETAA